MPAKPFLPLIALVSAALPAMAAASPNPASVFCVSMGGRVEIAKLRSGNEVGLCYLPKGRIVEEWTLFRMYDGKRPPIGLDRNPFMPPR